MRFASSTRVRSFVLAAATAASVGLFAASSGGCSSGNPLQSSCDRQEQCAKENGWQFSASECEQEASFAFEKAKTAACDPALSAYATCVDSLTFSCDDDPDEQGAKHCKTEASDLADCMQDAADSEAKDKATGGSTSSGGTANGSSSSSGGKSSSSSGGTSNGGLAAYCDKVSECANGALTASACKSQQSSASSAASAAGCGDELDALFGCAAKLDCNDLASYTSACADEYQAYTSSCGQ